MRLLGFFIALFPGFVVAKSSLPRDLIGQWQAIGYFYQGTFIEPTEARLLLTFEFLSNGTDILFWKNKDEKSFCERKGTWLVRDQTLIDEVVWTHPENGMDCSGDPDMQIGKINISYFWVENGQLFVEIPLANEVLVYVWNSKMPKR